MGLVELIGNIFVLGQRDHSEFSNGNCRIGDLLDPNEIRKHQFSQSAAEAFGQCHGNLRIDMELDPKFLCLRLEPANPAIKLIDGRCFGLHETCAAARWTLLGEAMDNALADALTGDLDETKLRHR